MIQSDWIRLLVKFKGKCSICYNIINPGEYALWSKRLKQIKHTNCSDNASNNTIYGETSANLVCFLCGNSSSLSNNFINNLLFDRDKDAIFICKSCLDDPTSFERYQNLMLEKLNRTARLKSY